MPVTKLSLATGSHIWQQCTSMILKSCKGKGEAVPVLLTDHNAMKVYCGSAGTAPLNLWLQH